MGKGERRPAPSANEKQQVSRLQDLLRFAEGNIAIEKFDELVRFVFPELSMVISGHDRMTPDKYDGLREWLKHGLERIADGADFTIPAQPLQMVITKGRFEYKGTDPIALRKQAVAAILSTQHWRVGRCRRFPRCRNLYVAINGSLYCTRAAAMPTACGSAAIDFPRMRRP